jgi:hypothetical protein
LPFITPTTTSSSTTSSTTSSSTSTTHPVAATTCHARDFTVTWYQGQGAAGTLYNTVTMRDKGTGSCVINGYPVLTLQDQYGAVLHTKEVRVPLEHHLYFPDSRANYGPKVLTVYPGTTVSFSLAVADVPVGTLPCVTAATLNVQLQIGESSAPVTLPYGLTACGGGQLFVSAVY